MLEISHISTFGNQLPKLRVTSSSLAYRSKSKSLKFKSIRFVFGGFLVYKCHLCHKILGKFGEIWGNFRHQFVTAEILKLVKFTLVSPHRLTVASKMFNNL